MKAKRQTTWLHFNQENQELLETWTFSNHSIFLTLTRWFLRLNLSNKLKWTFAFHFKFHIQLKSKEMWSRSMKRIQVLTYLCFAETFYSFSLADRVGLNASWKITSFAGFLYFIWQLVVKGEERTRWKTCNKKVPRQIKNTHFWSYGCATHSTAKSVMQAAFMMPFNRAFKFISLYLPVFCLPSIFLFNSRFGVFLNRALSGSIFFFPQLLPKHK